MIVQEMELPSQGRHKYRVRLYYNRLEPRHREKLPHSHLALEINLFSGGCKGTYVIGDKDYSIESGDIFILRSNEEHSIIHLENEQNCVCTGLQFSPDFIWSPSNELCDMKHVYSLFSDSNIRFNHKLDRSDELTGRVRELLSDIVDEFSHESLEYALMVKVKLISMLILLARNYNNTESANPVSYVRRENRMRIESTMSYIDAHLYEHLTLEKLAEVATMSTSYFSQLFKTLNGFSAWEYIVEKRIELAQKLLLSTDEPVLDIAFKCGFNNMTNFNRAFKKMTGISPREYRQRVNNQSEEDFSAKYSVYS